MPRPTTEVLRKVRVPNMLPFFFTALKVGTTLAFIGAIVGEYFGGASKVIGQVVLTASIATAASTWPGRGIMHRRAAAPSWPISLVSVVERLAIPWYASLRDGEA